MANNTYQQQKARVREQMVGCSREQWDRLEQIWMSLGLSDGHMSQRLDAVYQHTVQLYRSMVEDEETLLREKREKVAQLIGQLTALSQELSLEPYEAPAAASGLWQQERSMSQQLGALEEMKAVRMQQLATLVERDRALAEALEEPPYAIDDERIPSDHHLNQLRHHIDDLEKIKHQRRNKFNTVKEQILDMCEELAYSPDDTFSREIVFEDVDSFKMSKNNIDTVEEYLSDMEQKYNARKQAVAELKSKVSQLYDRLEITAQESDEFYAGLDGIKDTAVTKLTAELSRLEALKLTHMEMFISRIRTELTEWWQKAYYSEEQKKQFTSFTDNEYTEMLLDLHELELQKVKAYYTHNGKYLAMVQQWDELHTQYKYLQQRSKDPNRYTNRGAGLLGEQREWLRVEKELPRLENKISKVFQAYEAQHGEPLLVEGVRFPDFIAEVHRREAEEREREKQERNRVREEQKHQEIAYGTSAPSSAASKRKRELTTPDKSNVGKKSRLESTHALSPFGNRTGAVASGRSTLFTTPSRPMATRSTRAGGAGAVPRVTLAAGAQRGQRTTPLLHTVPPPPPPSRKAGAATGVGVGVGLRRAQSQKLSCKPVSAQNAAGGAGGSGSGGSSGNRRRALCATSQPHLAGAGSRTRAAGARGMAPPAAGAAGAAAAKAANDTGIFSHLPHHASHRSDPEMSTAFPDYTAFTRAINQRNEAFTSSVMHK